MNNKHFDFVLNEIQDLPERMIQENPSISFEEMKEKIINLKSNLTNDEVFLELLPIIYGFGIGLYRLNERKK